MYSTSQPGTCSPKRLNWLLVTGLSATKYLLLKGTSMYLCSNLPNSSAEPAPDAFKSEASIIRLYELVLKVLTTLL
ncbi:hypothetical protein [Gottschalkia acidurici]|uniref:hypothetical protein n=1 Tax=Clostridium acidurici TaxID=1556 RepID=UPI001E613CC8|nr:hypothetical protein [Gottschalkia acidurici]